MARLEADWLREALLTYRDEGSVTTDEMADEIMARAAAAAPELLAVLERAVVGMEKAQEILQGKHGGLTCYIAEAKAAIAKVGGA